MNAKTETILLEVLTASELGWTIENTLRYTYFLERAATAEGGDTRKALDKLVKYLHKYGKIELHLELGNVSDQVFHLTERALATR